jgi:hypothetical protein
VMMTIVGGEGGDSGDDDDDDRNKQVALAYLYYG